MSNRDNKRMQISKLKSNNIIFDNLWRNDNFFIGESSNKVVFLIPYDFRLGDQISKALIVILNNSSISFKRECEHDVCWLLVNEQLQYRVVSNVKNDNLVKRMVEGEYVVLNVRRDENRENDCIDFISNRITESCCKIAWRSKCRFDLTKCRKCVPQVIKGNIHHHDDILRYPTNTDIMLRDTSVSDFLTF